MAGDPGDRHTHCQPSAGRPYGGGKTDAASAARRGEDADATLELVVGQSGQEGWNDLPCLSSPGDAPRGHLVLGMPHLRPPSSGRALTPIALAAGQPNARRRRWVSGGSMVGTYPHLGGEMMSLVVAACLTVGESCCAPSWARSG